MPQRVNVPPLGAFAFGKDSGFGNNLGARLVHQQTHPLQRAARADHIVNQNHFFAAQKALVFFVEIQRLRLPVVIESVSTLNVCPMYGL